MGNQFWECKTCLNMFIFFKTAILNTKEAFPSGYYDIVNNIIATIPKRFEKNSYKARIHKPSLVYYKLLPKSLAVNNTFIAAAAPSAGHCNNYYYLMYYFNYCFFD